LEEGTRLRNGCHANQETSHPNIDKGHFKGTVQSREKRRDEKTKIRGMIRGHEKINVALRSRTVNGAYIRNNGHKQDRMPHVLGEKKEKGEWKNLGGMPGKRRAWPFANYSKKSTMVVGRDLEY